VDAAGPAPCSLIVPGALGVAINDMTTAYINAAGRPTPDFVNLGAGNITGLTLVPGLYKWGTDVLVNAAGVTLSGGPNAVWIFQIAGDLTLANNAHIILAGGAQANNIFWQVGASNFGATLGTGSAMYGTILSAKQIIENTGASLVGRALAQTQVTLQSTTVTTPGLLVGGVPVPLPPTVTSTVPAALSGNVPIGNAISADSDRSQTSRPPARRTIQSPVIHHDPANSHDWRCAGSGDLLRISAWVRRALSGECTGARRSSSGQCRESEHGYWRISVKHRNDSGSIGRRAGFGV
jgi:hypothetical protein